MYSQILLAKTKKEILCNQLDVYNQRKKCLEKLLLNRLLSRFLAFNCIFRLEGGDKCKNIFCLVQIIQIHQKKI